MPIYSERTGNFGSGWITFSSRWNLLMLAHGMVRYDASYDVGGVYHGTMS